MRPLHSLRGGRGRSSDPGRGDDDYDTLADDPEAVLDTLDLSDRQAKSSLQTKAGNVSRKRQAETKAHRGNSS